VIVADRDRPPPSWSVGVAGLVGVGTDDSEVPVELHVDLGGGSLSSPPPQAAVMPPPGGQAGDHDGAAGDRSVRSVLACRPFAVALAVPQ
jgi:hypothetical protein